MHAGEMACGPCVSHTDCPSAHVLRYILKQQKIHKQNFRGAKISTLKNNERATFQTTPDGAQPAPGGWRWCSRWWGRPRRSANTNTEKADSSVHDTRGESQAKGKAGSAARAPNACMPTRHCRCRRLPPQQLPGPFDTSAHQHKALAHLVVVQERLVGLVDGAGLHLAGAAGAGARAAAVGQVDACGAEQRARCVLKVSALRMPMYPQAAAAKGVTAGCGSSS